MNNRSSRHHLLFPAAEWSLRPQGAEMRSTPSLIARITRDEHDYMHRQVAIIPALGHNTLRAVSRLWIPEHETYRDLDGLCRAIGKAATHERSHRIESDLAGLTIEALEMEREILKEIGYRDGR